MSLLNNLTSEETILKNKPHTSSFVFRRLPEGMGVVLGNYLRQFLLKYTSEMVPIGVKISDRDGSKKVEVGELSGVNMTIPYLVMNLKKIVVEENKKKEGIFCLELSIENKEKKEKVITAGDFKKNKDIKVKNPDLYLATLATPEEGNPKLEIKLYYQKNWGYQEERDEEWRGEVKNMIKKYFPNDEDVIVLDANFSPVRQVSFQEKKAVVSSTKGEEELTITITTNGSIEPQDALQEVLELSKSSFNSISDSLTNNKEKEKRAEEVKI